MSRVFFTNISLTPSQERFIQSKLDAGEYHSLVVSSEFVEWFFVCSQTMPYSQFKTIGDAIDAFDLTLEEGKFFPEVAPIAPSNTLSDYLADTLPAVADGQRKSTLRRHYLPRPACTNIP